MRAEGGRNQGDDKELVTRRPPTSLLPGTWTIRVTSVSHVGSEPELLKPEPQGTEPSVPGDAGPATQASGASQSSWAVQADVGVSKNKVMESADWAKTWASPNPAL